MTDDYQVKNIDKVIGTLRELRAAAKHNGDTVKMIDYLLTGDSLEKVTSLMTIATTLIVKDPGMALTLADLIEAITIREDK